MEITIENYLPKNQEEKIDILSDPIAKRARDYFNEVHTVAYLTASMDEKADDIIILAVANYNYTCTKHITNGGDTSVADEIGMSELQKVIDDEVKSLTK